MPERNRESSAKIACKSVSVLEIVLMTMESEMIKKLLIFLTILVLMVVSTTPALAQKPPESNGKGNTTDNNHRNGNSANDNGGNRNAANPDVHNGNTTTNRDGNVNATNNNGGHGFDDSGYNRTARIFNGTAWGWCMEKVGDEAWCNEYLGPSKYDKLIMKWNAEWDRGNAENWAHPPYDAWENNQWNGNVPGGSGDVWHYKIVWVGPCGADGNPLPNGGYCLWGQFEVIMDQGTLDGVHIWLTHAKPNGYGSYP